MDTSSRRPGIPPEIGVLAVVASASLPLGRIFREGAPGEMDYGTLHIVVLLASGVIAWGSRRLRLPVLVAALVSAAGFLWLASALFHSGAMLGPFPTPRSVDLLFDSMAKGMRQVNTEVAPVAPTAGFLSLAAIGIWATLWLADDAANRLRHPLLAIGLALPVFAMPGTLLRGTHTWFEVAMFCGASLLLLFQDERVRISRWAGRTIHGWKPGIAARIATLAIVLGVVFAPLLPGYGQPPGGSIRAQGGGGRVTVNPLVSIKPTLDRFPAVTLFRVHATESTYWRLTALDRFNGVVWTSSPDRGRISLSRPAKRSSPAPRSTRLVQQITIDQLAGPWLPGAFEPVSVRGVRGVYLTPVTRSLVAQDSFRTGQRITVTSELPDPRAEDLLEDEGSDTVGARYLELPDNLPPIIRSIAVQVTSTAGAATRLERAIALQDYLRTFEYDLEVALRHSSFDLVRFLTDIRAGYCEQFAAAMAVMARSLGIPARVAIGFAGGDLVDRDTYQVTSNNAHAWVEIHFPGFGWMAFEPTPRSDGPGVPSYSRLTPDSATPTASPTAAPATPTPSATGTSRLPNDRGENAPPVTTPGGRSTALAPLVGLVLLAVALLALPGVAFVRRLLRRRAARKSGASRRFVEVRYLEFLEWCRAVALGRGAGETPVEHARRLGSLPHASPQPLKELAAIATAAVYAAEGDGAGEIDRAVRAARNGLSEAVPLSRRVLPVIGWGWWRSETKPDRPRR